MTVRFLSMGVLLSAIAMTGCGDNINRENDQDDGGFGDTDTGTDTDTGADTDTGTDTDTGADTEIGPDAGTDTGANTDDACEMGTFVGDVEVTDQVGLDALAGYTKIDGKLYVHATDIVDLSALHCLAEVTSFIGLVENPSLVSVELPDLVTVAGGVDIGSNEALTTVALPSLDGNIGGLGVNNNPELQTVSIPSLDTAEDVKIVGNPKLVSIQLDSLEEQTDLGFSIRNNDALTTFELPSLRSSADGFSVVDNDALISFSLPSLQVLYLSELGGTLVVANNPALTSFSVPSLASAEGIRIAENALLPQLFLPTSLHASDLYSFLVMDNPQLPTCEIRDYIDALLASGDAPEEIQIEYSGNMPDDCI